MVRKKCCLKTTAYNGVSDSEGIMDIGKVTEYRKSIKFELIRSKLALDEYIELTTAFFTGQVNETNTLAQIRAFDAYSRWLGHLYESLLALVIIDKKYNASESSKYDVTDPLIQRVAKESLARFKTSIENGILDKHGFVSLNLENEFASDLRIIRNKCSFHCSNNRVKSNMLQEFINKHHHMAFYLYAELYYMHGELDSECRDDLGAISQFFSVSQRSANSVNH